LKGGKDDKMSRTHKVTVEAIGISKEQLIRVMSDQLGWEGEADCCEGISVLDGDGDIQDGMSEEEAHEEIYKALKELNPKAKIGTQWTCMDNLPFECYGDNVAETAKETVWWWCSNCGLENDSQNTECVECHAPQKTVCPKCKREITHLTFYAKVEHMGVFQPGHVNSDHWDTKNHGDWSNLAFSCSKCNGVLFTTENEAVSFLESSQNEKWLH